MEREPRVLIAIPSTGMFPMEFVNSLILLDKPKDTHIRYEVGSLVYAARNHLTSHALRLRADYMLWLDSDMEFQPDTLMKLLNHAKQGKDYVSGLYFRRGTPTSPVLAKKIEWDLTEDGVQHKVENLEEYPNHVFEIAGAGFGCVLTKTKLLWEVGKKFNMSPFEPLPGLGEDYSLAWRIGQMGIKMWCDPTIKLGHVGTKVYTEEDYIREKNESRN